ncbi:MAG: NUDIX domain-containing protein [Spirochaetota bacterium]
MKTRISSAEVVFREFFTIEKLRLSWQQFDGSMTGDHTRYVIRRGDSVGILCVCGGRPGGGVERPAEEEERIVLVKQFRCPAAREGHDGYLWEIPAGMVHEGEDPGECARRELEEETGLAARRLTLLTSFFLSPGAMDEKMHLFRAEVDGGSLPARVGGNPEESENLLVRLFRMRTLLRMIREGVIADSKTVAAVLLHHALGPGGSGD